MFSGFTHFSNYYISNQYIENTHYLETKENIFTIYCEPDSLFYY